MATPKKNCPPRGRLFQNSKINPHFLFTFSFHFRSESRRPVDRVGSTVVYLENVFEVGFMPCLWLIWRSKLGRVGFRVNGTLLGRFLVKNSTNRGKGEPLACYGVQRHATVCTARHSMAQHTMAWGYRRHSLFCLLPTSDDYNFFVRTPFLVFLDSMESPLSQKSIHMHVDGNWCPQHY